MDLLAERNIVSIISGIFGSTSDTTFKVQNMPLIHIILVISDLIILTLL